MGQQNSQNNAGYTFQTLTGNRTLTDQDNTQLAFIASGANRKIYLQNTLKAGKRFTIKNYVTWAGSGIYKLLIICNGNGSGTENTYAELNSGETISVFFDGTDWGLDGTGGVKLTQALDDTDHSSMMIGSCPGTRGADAVRIGMGNGNLGTASVGIGASAQGDGDYAVTIGATANCGSSGDYGVALGYNATVNYKAGIALGYISTLWVGEVAINGDDLDGGGRSRRFDVNHWGVTTNNTQTEIYLLGISGKRMDGIQNNSLVSFEGIIHGKTSSPNNSDQDVYSYKITGAFQTNNAGTISIVGSVTKTLIAVTAGAATWDSTIDASSASIRVKVTGATSKTINWSARLWGTIIRTDE